MKWAWHKHALEMKILVRTTIARTASTANTYIRIVRFPFPAKRHSGKMPPEANEITELPTRRWPKSSKIQISYLQLATTSPLGSFGPADQWDWGIEKNRARVKDFKGCDKQLMPGC